MVCTSWKTSYILCHNLGAGSICGGGGFGDNQGEGVVQKGESPEAGIPAKGVAA